MKKLMMLIAALTTTVVFAEGTMSLADARAKIGSMIADPASTTAIMRELSPADQNALVADLNKAVSKLPDSAEKKAATCLLVNEAAIKGAAKGNLGSLIAEVFATVPVEMLPFVSERIAADLFNRAADPSKPFTDPQFTKIAEDLMKKINDRAAQTDDAAARSTMGIVMLVAASNGSPADLSDTLVNTLPADQQDIVRNEWLPAALAEGEDKNFDAIIGSSTDAGREPVASIALKIAGPQVMEAMLADFHTVASDHPSRTPHLDIIHDPEVIGGFAGHGMEYGFDTVPREPDGYQWQY